VQEVCCRSGVSEDSEESDTASSLLLLSNLFSSPDAQALPPRREGVCGLGMTPDACCAASSAHVLLGVPCVIINTVSTQRIPTRAGREVSLGWRVAREIPQHFLHGARASAAATAFYAR
jgi:hypothetical protein